MPTKTKRVNVKINRETAKALLVSDGANEAWVQRRWFDVTTGTVSAKTWQKAIDNAAERKEQWQAELADKKAEQEFRHAKHSVRVEKETEKAVAIKITVEMAGNESELLVWFPKSCIEGGEGVAEIMGWMLNEKINDKVDNYTGSGYYEKHRWCKGERATLVRGPELFSENSEN